MLTLELLRDYEKKNPRKYLMKFGTVTAKDGANQPTSWQYRSPEEVMNILPPQTVVEEPTNVVMSEKKEMEVEFVEDPTGGVVASSEKPKRGRKAKN